MYAGSCDNSVFNFVRNLHTVFHPGCTTLHSHWLYTDFFFLFPHQHLLFVFFFDDGYSDRCEVALICISLMINHAELLLRCLLAICMFSLEKCLFSSSAPFFNWAFFWSVLSCLNCFYILDINSDTEDVSVYLSSQHLKKMLNKYLQNECANELINWMNWLIAKNAHYKSFGELVNSQCTSTSLQIICINSLSWWV